VSKLLTIAIPCRNGAAHLEQALRSVLAQTCAEQCAFVFVDDASTDDSVAIARRVGGQRLRVERNSEQRGLAGNWNRCADLVETPFFALVHQDDVYDPEFGRTMLRALEAEPRAAFAHCPARTIDEHGAVVDSAVEDYKAAFWASLPDLTAPREMIERLRLGNFVICPSVVYRTDAFRSVGPFETGLHALDWQHHARVAFAGHSVVNVREPLLAYRRHGGNQSKENTLTLDRYREEASILRWIDDQARQRHWLNPRSAPSRALRNNLLFDTYNDLLEGAPERARDRLRFARDEARDLAWDWMTRITATAARLGPLGRSALGLGLRLAVWSARVRATRPRHRSV
jgi:glycosyltransferase involved in cell wall biosynthesis